MPESKVKKASPYPVLAAALGQVPRASGVYLFKDAAGKVLYVGKAVEPEKPPGLVSQDPGAPRPQDRPDAEEDGPGGLPHHRRRPGGAHPGAQPHQGAPSPLQRHAAGRQELSLPAPGPEGGVSGPALRAALLTRRGPLFRALYRGRRRPGDPQGDERGLPGAHLQGAPPGAALPAVPGVSDATLPGTLRRDGERRRLRPGGAGSHPVPQRQEPPAAEKAQGRHG